MKAKDGAPEEGKAAVDRSWHLARNPVEVDVAELEYALMRAFEAFGRWQGECLASVIDLVASGLDPAQIDADAYRLDVSLSRANSFPDDLGSVIVEALDVASNVLSTLLDTGLEAILPEDSWVLRGVSQASYPLGARSLRIRLLHQRVALCIERRVGGRGIGQRHLLRKALRAHPEKSGDMREHAVRLSLQLGKGQDQKLLAWEQAQIPEKLHIVER